jgi:asparagine synthase (glutamine-hydrolysing)
LEIAHPTSDNDFIDVLLKIPLELRLNHSIYRKFLKKLSPELARIPYNKTMVRADAPLFFWRVADTYLSGKALIKEWIQKFSKGKIFLADKRGFVNLKEWLRVNEDWRGYFKTLLLTETTISKKYFNQDFIKLLIQQHEAGKSDNSFKILYLATFELFLRQFFANSLKKP